jgi:HPt (histidine-containing phosphotransfer) domain-containing protein
MKYLTALAAAIALLALAAGCGGGGDSSSSGSSGETNASAGGDADSAAANEACATANQKIAALPIPDHEQAVVEYLEQTEETVAELQAEVAGLNGSAGITEYSEALASSVAVLNEMANAARSRNPDEVRELSKELENLHLGKVAEAAGLETCAEAPKVES